MRLRRSLQSLAMTIGKVIRCKLFFAPSTKTESKKERIAERLYQKQATKNEFNDYF